ncbi:MAG: Na(+)-translocating NADH-quinone reductase subunit A [Muribaculaceae bacterium]|nr:Na(+)-translocating NADH-quinone reductase subunit A [Muribaculaceae bacterium]
MRKTINLKKGLNMRLEGQLTDTCPVADVKPEKIAIVPDDYPGFLPKPEVKEGETVIQGAPLMHDKNDPDVKLVSPICGTVESITRGARRKIERIVVKRSNSDSAPTAIDVPESPTGEDVRKALKVSGLWAMMRRRPYDILPMDSDRPRDIFVTGMDTAPLAIDLYRTVAGKEAEMDKGVEALKSLTKGSVYISVAQGSNMPDIKGAEIVEFNNLHPAGNAGVQIANIAPVNKGDVVWCLDIVTLVKIGELMLTGRVDFTVTVAITGSEVEHPKAVTTLPGAPLAQLLEKDVKEDGRHHRIISGNVLTGTNEGIEGYLRYPYRQVTVIPEGDDTDEFMGWASLSPNKMSESRSFLGRFLGKKFNPDARLNGGRRAMIMSGVYDRYIPMDIEPEYLLKAIISRDIDRMEALGIYEVAPEDFALAEYADPSKLELQRIVREGLDYMHKEA